ncbi:MAG: DUF1127 domain-containing protein [Stappiaceae bacterium]
MVLERIPPFCADPNQSKPGLTASITRWFGKTRDIFIQKQDFMTLLRASDRALEDIGLSRSDLAREFGHDACELERVHAASAYPNPNLWNNSAIYPDHHKSHR